MDHTIISDRYELDSRIGHGGMAQVYLATDRLLGRQVAVKVLARSFATDAAFVERFKREAQAAAALNHPNVVPIYDWGTVDDTYYIVMAYVPGLNLKETLRRSGPLPETEVLRIGMQVAAALEVAHQHGIIHRDIKPHNILLDPRGQVVVTDFGIAHAVGSSQLTESHVILGTAEYLSPEQAQRGQVDGRADIYSLGIVLYELLTGRTPFTGETLVAVAWQHLHQRPPRPRELGCRISAPTERAVLKAITKDPARRYQTAAELRDALQEVRAWLLRVSGSAPLVPREVHGSETRPSDPRGGKPRPRTWMISLVALMLIVTAVAGLLLSRSTPLVRPPDAEMPGVAPRNSSAQSIASRSNSASPEPTPVSRSALQPSPSERAAPGSTADPVAAVMRFYQFVGQHQFDQAASLWTPNMRANYPPAQNITERFSNTEEMTVQRAKAISVDGATGKATVAVDVLEVVEPSTTRRWVGSWHLVRGPDGWLLDQPNLQPT